MADVVLAHLVADHVLGDDALLEAFAEEPEEELLLVGVGVGLVVCRGRVVAEQPPAEAAEPAAGARPDRLLGPA